MDLDMEYFEDAGFYSPQFSVEVEVATTNQFKSLHESFLASLPTDAEFDEEELSGKHNEEFLTWLPSQDKISEEEHTCDDDEYDPASSSTDFDEECTYDGDDEDEADDEEDNEAQEEENDNYDEGTGDDILSHLPLYSEQNSIHPKDTEDLYSLPQYSEFIERYLNVAHDENFLASLPSELGGVSMADSSENGFNSLSSEIEGVSKADLLAHPPQNIEDSSNESDRVSFISLSQDIEGESLYENEEISSASSQTVADEQSLSGNSENLSALLPHEVERDSSEYNADYLARSSLIQEKLRNGRYGYFVSALEDFLDCLPEDMDFLEEESTSRDMEVAEVQPTYPDIQHDLTVMRDPMYVANDRGHFYIERSEHVSDHDLVYAMDVAARVNYFTSNYEVEE